MQLEDEFGDIIAKARVGNGLSVAELATATSSTDHNIREIEAYRLLPNAEIIAQLASLLGLDAVKLKSIINNWTPQPSNPSNESMIVETIHVPYGAYGVNAYILGCLRTGLAAVIDPGGAISNINERLSINELTLSTVLITHSHDDHIGGLRELIKAWPSSVVIGSPLDQAPIMRGISALWHPAVDQTDIEIGELTITALSTPGHTPGSTCYATKGACFVGDTLFSGSIGHPASSTVYADMLAAIKNKVLSLPDNTAIFPGHGPTTTVAEENAYNPFF